MDGDSPLLQQLPHRLAPRPPEQLQRLVLRGDEREVDAVEPALTEEGRRHQGKFVNRQRPNRGYQSRTTASPSSYRAASSRVFSLAASAFMTGSFALLLDGSQPCSPVATLPSRARNRSETVSEARSVG